MKILYPVFITISLVLMTFSESFGQDSVKIEYKHWEHNFTYREMALNPEEMLSLYQNIPEAFDLMATAKKNKDIAFVCTYTGILVLSYPIISGIFGSYPGKRLSPVAIGTGLLLISVPIHLRFAPRAIRATEIYNSKLEEQTSYWLEIDQTSEGIGLRFSF